MADNYLEKKFEEHLSAASRPAKKHTPTRERKAVVLGGAGTTGSAIVRALRVAGNRVALCDLDDTRGEETALRNGAEYKHVDVRDREALVGYLRELATRWGAIDIVVCSARASIAADAEWGSEALGETLQTSVEDVMVVAQLMAEMHVESHTATRRLVSIGHLDDGYLDKTACGALASLTEGIAGKMSDCGVAINSIVVTRETEEATNIARVVRFVTEENNDFLNGKTIEI